MSKLIINCETGEETLTELSKAELDQQKIDVAAEKAIQAEKLAEENAKAAILDRIGLTADELKTILG